MARPKYDTPMVRKNVFIPEKLAAAITHVMKNNPDVTEADIFRGAIYQFVDRYRRATTNLQKQMLEDAKKLSK
jgi:hypothetical protein